MTNGNFLSFLAAVSSSPTAGIPVLLLMPIRSYDDIAPHYDRALRPLNRWFLARLRASTFQYLPRDARTLEIGAGTGLNFIFYPANSAGVATEPSSGMLNIASQKERPEGVRLVQSCAQNIPFADNSFDAAVATLVFCSLPQPEAAFSELRRVVRSGGMVLLLEHVRPDNLLGPVLDALNWITVPLFADHCNRRTSRSAEAAGLKVVKLEKRMMGIINLIACRV